jgi:hypothetical protein
MKANELSKAAAALGRKGGKVKSEAKSAAARENGKRGGRPSIPFDPVTGEYLEHHNLAKTGRTSAYEGRARMGFHNLYVIRRDNDLLRDSRGVPFGFRTAAAARAAAVYFRGDKVGRVLDMPLKVRRA